MGEVIRIKVIFAISVSVSVPITGIVPIFLRESEVGARDKIGKLGITVKRKSEEDFFLV